jgi:carbon monoxide dehydrogenase subunit G
MKIEGTHTIKAARQRLFHLLTDPDVLKRCVPGCQSLEANEDGSYKMTMKTGIGSIKGVFTGSIRLEDIQEPSHYKMIVDGKGAPGFVKGIGELDLTEQEDETIVAYAGDISAGGTIASVGQRMILSSAKMLANQFFTSIDAEVEAIAKAEESGEQFEAPKHGFIRNAIRRITK